MPRQISLAKLRTHLRRRTDTENETDRFPDAEMNDYINSGVDMFRQEMIILGGQGLDQDDTFFTTQDGVEMYALPAEWVQVIKVWTYVDGSVERVYRPYQEIETDGLREPSSGDSAARWFRIIGDNLSIRPKPDGEFVIHVRYAAVASELTSDLQTTDGLGGFEEYMVCWAGKQVALKQTNERLEASLDNQRKEVLYRLRAIQKKRSALPPSITDVTGPSMANQKAWRWRARFP